MATKTSKKGTSKKGTSKKGTSKKGTSKKSTAKRPHGPARSGPRKRRTPFSGKKITKLQRENPRREGTHGHKSWELIKNGMTVDAYLDAGGRMNDLRWDLSRKRIKLTAA